MTGSIEQFEDTEVVLSIDLYSEDEDITSFLEDEAERCMVTKRDILLGYIRKVIRDEKDKGH